MAESNVEQPCPHCSTLSPRDISEEARTGNFGESEEQYSEAAGVHPSQIAEARAKFPSHRFLPDGRMIFKGQREKERVLKDLGFVEYTKYDKFKSGK